MSVVDIDTTQVACPELQHASPEGDAPVSDALASSHISESVKDAKGSTAGSSHAEAPAEWTLEMLLLSLQQIANSGRVAYIFATVPLHFLDSDWPLWHYGVLTSCAMAIRLPISALVAHCGEWVCVPNIISALIGSLVMALDPEWRPGVYLGIFCTLASQNTQNWRGFAFLRFGASASYARANRVISVSQVMAYSMGPMIGGVLYEFGGFPLCAFWQLACALVQFGLLFFMLALLRDSFRSGKKIEKSSKLKSRSNLPSSFSWQPALVVLIAALASIFTYMTEWATFAAYFRQVYKWGSAWTGVAQMSGDLLAGICLFASACTRHGGSGGGSRCVVLRPPLSVSCLFLLYALFFIMLADEQRFAVAVIGQVFLGSVYVFAEQAVLDMLVIYSYDDPPCYRRLMFGYQLAYSIGMSLSGCQVLVYEKVGRLVPFYMVSVLSVVVAICWTTYFYFRLGGAFFSGNLAHAEKIRAEAYHQEESKI